MDTSKYRDSNNINTSNGYYGRGRTKTGNHDPDSVDRVGKRDFKGKAKMSPSEELGDSTTRLDDDRIDDEESDNYGEYTAFSDVRDNNNVPNFIDSIPERTRRLSDREKLQRFNLVCMICIVIDLVPIIINIGLFFLWIPHYSLSSGKSLVMLLNAYNVMSVVRPIILMLMVLIDKGRIYSIYGTGRCSASLRSTKNRKELNAFWYAASIMEIAFIVTSIFINMILWGVLSREIEFFAYMLCNCLVYSIEVVASWCILFYIGTKYNIESDRKRIARSSDTEE